MLKNFYIRKHERTGLNGKIYNFFVGCGTVDASDFEDIHMYWSKKHNIL